MKIGLEFAGGALTGAAPVVCTHLMPVGRKGEFTASDGIPSDGPELFAVDTPFGSADLAAVDTVAKATMLTGYHDLVVPILEVVNRRAGLGVYYSLPGKPNVTPLISRSITTAGLKATPLSHDYAITNAIACRAFDKRQYAAITQRGSSSISTHGIDATVRGADVILLVLQRT